MELLRVKICKSVLEISSKAAGRRYFIQKKTKIEVLLSLNEKKKGQFFRVDLIIYFG